MLAAEEDANFAVPWVTSVEGLFWTVDVVVSSTLATMNIRATGLEKTMVCGRRRRFRREFLTEVMSVARPEAFSMIDLAVNVSKPDFPV
ncbi:hypothetical protein VP1G_10579 [Cytospora mali]|uniref:Uncharacterized protein n=1 Tax=Cytospora mali TaxID=578113 RepID=A0A194UQA7_CYTMA|nr:hypothetical protein VP1G_10579 [Valsa mali var. pyri (nom. inval.)]